MIKEIKEYGKVTSRFHTPGHSGRTDIDELYLSAKYDITELSFSDNLHAPNGIIARLEDRLARAYGSKRALISTAGATLAIQIALLVAREIKGRICILGDAHKSCYAFASVIGLDIIEISTMEEAIKKISCGEWIYVTTPDYYGKVMDISSLIKNRCDGGAVIVDEAHGAHFVFSELLPHSWSGEADFVIESMHKTLPVMTGGAVLNVNNDEYSELAEYFRTKIHTTSPSYLIMSSMDCTLDIMESGGESLYKNLKEKTEKFVKALSGTYNVRKTDDFTRIVIDVANAESIVKYLENNGTYVELYDNNTIVMIVTPWNGDRLMNVASQLIEYKENNCSDTACDNTTISDVPARKVRAKGFRGKLMFLGIEESIGKVVMNEIGVYPPGVPILTLGDVMTQEAASYIVDNIDRIVGLIGNKVAVREICEED